jgi:hypothetical protein
MGHVNIFVDSGSYGLVELAHSVLSHYLADALLLKKN